MRLEHITGMQAGYTMGLQPDGRELLVVCLKGTFTIPKNGQEPRLSEEQVPLLEADVFTGEPGLGAAYLYPPRLTRGRGGRQRRGAFELYRVSRIYR